MGLQTVVESDPRNGPVYLSKIDITDDAFHRIWLNIYNIPKQGVVLPTFPGAPQVVVFPLELFMVWVEFPSFFVPRGRCVLEQA